ncbi:MAG: hypothetical protein JRH11_05820 [Deltaproteobacteria bacterium]|nr:hypothetical protein [Deltaproteobacteria bacterium]
MTNSLSTLAACIALLSSVPSLASAQSADGEGSAALSVPRAVESNVRAGGPETIEVAPAHHDPARRRSPGRPFLITGTIALSLGVTAVAFGAVGYATRGYQIVCIWGCSPPDYSAPGAFVVTGALTTALGIGLLVAGALSNKGGRGQHSRGPRVLPTFAVTGSGNGLTLGAVGIF